MPTHLKTLLCALALGPLSALAINVTEFGAIPDDGLDDTPAFLAAFATAQTQSVARVKIPKGLYRLRADANPKRPDTLLPIAGTTGMVIDGRGAELLISGTASLFSFSECTNTSIRGLRVDWLRPPFSQGVVVASNPRWFEIEVAPNYPVAGGEPVGAFMSYDPVTQLPAGRDLDVYDSVERTELVRPQVLRVHLKRDIPVPEGTLLVLRHQVYGHNAFLFHRCDGVKVTDVTVYSTPGMGLVAIQSADVALRRFDVRLRPGSGRLMSATADATHFGGCRGTVTLRDCAFEGMGDDGANIKSGLYLLVRQRLDDHTVLGQHNLKMRDLPDPGDVLELCHTDTLLPFASCKVEAATLQPGTENLHRIRFTEALPPELRIGDVLGNASRVPRLRMLNCTVKANRARGVLCQTRDALIEHCLFQNCTSAGVLVLTEVVHFHESIGTRGVTVRNNRFENCNRGAAAAPAPLAALAWLKDFAYPPKPGVHQDVTFEENTIFGHPGTAIFAAGVDGLVIRRNRILAPAAEGRPDPDRAPIQIVNCARVLQE
jgi:hypothetical protein